MVRDSIRKSSCFLNFRLLLQTISCGISESPLHFFFLCNCAGMKHHKTLLHVYEARRPRQRTYFPPSLRCMVWMEWREKCSWNRAERWQPPITDQLTAGNRQSQLNFYSSTRNIRTLLGDFSNASARSGNRVRTSVNPCLSNFAKIADVK